MRRMASDTNTAEGLSVPDVKRLLASNGVDYSACLERSELVALAESHGLFKNASVRSEEPESAQALPIARDSASDISPDVPLDMRGAPAGVPGTVFGGAEPSAHPQRSIGELKALLELHGIDHSRCLYRADLEALVRGLPVPGAAAATAGAALPRSGGGGNRKGGGSGSLSVEALAALDGPPLFAALRAILDVAERRRVTGRVHAVKMALWRLKPAFRGMPQHLTEEVHPMFRSGFQQVLRASEKRGSVVVSSFEATNRGLHGHHGNEDRAWFPALRRLHPELRGDLDVLEADHRALVALEGRITKDKDVDALTEFVALLDDHLNREELMTVPALMDGTGGW